ncbi:hypothetical protein [Kutzneria sp. NPDC051319]|uniref:hypothetical protein n=1 Tax=Kutzneria sp. NPDC051319 TaxID=3155047 RepID=UPI003438805B
MLAVLGVLGIACPLGDVSAGVAGHLVLDRATVELGALMFAGYPGYSPADVQFPDVSDPGGADVGEMPVVHSADDMRALVTRLRLVLEDPRQLLSGAVIDLAVDALSNTCWDPTKVVVPGLTGVRYPTDL